MENGHTVPAIETLEKLARAMEIPMYALFYDGEEPPKIQTKLKEADGWGSKGADARTFQRFRRLLVRTSKADQKLLMHLASKMATIKPKH